MLTGCDWHGDEVEPVLGIGGVVVVPVVVTVDDATLGLAASISVMATITNTTRWPNLMPVVLRVLVKGVTLLEWCHQHVATDVPSRAGDCRRERH